MRAATNPTGDPMANPNDTHSMALFCDFENVALGVREAKYAEVRHREGARAPAAQGQHRGEEGLLRLGPLQGVQDADARGRVRADRDPARAAVGQELGRHPHGGRCARPLLHQVARGYLRHHQRRLGFLAAGLQAARERQDGDRRRRQEIDLRPAHRQLRRVHLLRRPGARGGKAAQAVARREARGPAKADEEASRRDRRAMPTRSRRRSTW